MDQGGEQRSDARDQGDWKRRGSFRCSSFLSGSFRLFSLLTCALSHTGCRDGHRSRCRRSRSVRPFSSHLLIPPAFAHSSLSRSLAAPTTEDGSSTGVFCTSSARPRFAPFADCRSLGSSCSGIPPIRILQQLQAKHPELMKDKKTQIFLDGGITRGTDVLKASLPFLFIPLPLADPPFVSFVVRQALCMGATAVGLGRPFLYAQSAYETRGVVKAVHSKSWRTKD